MDAVNLIREGRLKRFFRSRNKITFPGAVCHITQRAPGKEQLFLEESDYLYVLHLIKQTAKEFHLDVFSFVLMPNHLHILLRINEMNLSKAMKNLFESYAKFFNKKYQRKGHVFSGAYRCAICLDDSYLLAASLYIHLNPLRAKLALNFQDYRWSSSMAYLKPLKKEAFLNYSFILEILDKDLDKGRKKYRSLLDEMVKVKTKDVLENPRAIENFRMKFIKVFKILLRNSESTAVTKILSFADEELENLINQLEQKKRLRNPVEIKARRYLIEQLRSRGFTLEEIADRLSITRQSIYNYLNFTK